MSAHVLMVCKCPTLPPRGASEFAPLLIRPLCRKLLKISARVRVTVRCIWIHLSESWSNRERRLHTWGRLRPS